MTQHGYPYQDPGQQHGGQPPYGQPQQGQQPGQPQYGDPFGQPQSGHPYGGQAAPAQQFSQPPPGQQYGEPSPGQQYGEPSPGQQFGQSASGQQFGQSAPGQQYGQPAPGQFAHPGQQSYGEQQYAHVPVSGYGVPTGAPGYGHVAHPPPGAFAGQQQAGYMSQRPVAPGGQELADVWTRLLARLIDGLIVSGLVLIVVVPLVIVVFAMSLDSGDSGGGTLLGVLLITELAAFVLTLAGQYVYDVEYAKRSGQTVGKRVMKLRIVALDPNQPVDRGVLAKRWLVSSPGGLVPGLGMLNVLWCLWDQPYRQCLHDKFAKTVVVKVPA